MDLLLDLCNELIVLNEGRVLAKGEPWSVRKDEKVIEAYFGRR